MAPVKQSSESPATTAPLFRDSPCSPVANLAFASPVSLDSDDEEEAALVELGQMIEADLVAAGLRDSATELEDGGSLSYVSSPSIIDLTMDDSSDDSSEEEEGSPRPVCAMCGGEEHVHVVVAVTSSGREVRQPNRYIPVETEMEDDEDFEEWVN